MNDKQILKFQNEYECFKSFLTLSGLVVTKAHTYLNKPAAKGCRFV